MTKRMLIDASQREETRVVVSDGRDLQEFDVEFALKSQLKGNIYLAKVVRVEPSLQAAFVDYGGDRHGFLAFSEIHPDYFQIPTADREQLAAEQARLVAEDRLATERDDDQADERADERADEAPGEDDEAGAAGSDNGDEAGGDEAGGDAADDHRDKAGDEGTPSAAPPAPPARRRRRRLTGGAGDDERERAEAAMHAAILKRGYRIQEVVKRRQILLVQVTKEERGSKGAALTTHLSIAGRYCVLMPNTPRGGGISRKIADAKQRHRLKDIAAALEVPEGMGLIVRTAGQGRTRPEITRDFKSLLKQWEEIRSDTLQSHAPSLIYEEAHIVKRAIRDLYAKDIDEVLVEGDEGYRMAKACMKTLMPSHAARVKPYKDAVPLFQHYGVEQQLEAVSNPVVTLKSGGTIVIDSTEALVAIDVNSGRSTRERNIEETALKTNLEAAQEIARQLRLRNLAGLIVIDFIDMDESRNERLVERKLKEALKGDRARIQTGRISAFGLLELSRQRLRPSLHEALSRPCPRCSGTGHVRSPEATALSLLRAIEARAAKGEAAALRVALPVEAAFCLLNGQRRALAALEERHGIQVLVAGDEELAGGDIRIEASAATAAGGGQAAPPRPSPPARARDEGGEGEEEGGRRRRRRRRKEGEEESAGAAETGDGAQGEDGPSDDERKHRRRGRRGGRRRRTRGEGEAGESETGAEAAPAAEAPAEGEAAPEKAKPRSRRRRRKRDDGAAEDARETALADPEAAPAPAEEDAPSGDGGKNGGAPVVQEAGEAGVEDAGEEAPEGGVTTTVVAAEGGAADGDGARPAAPRRGWWQRIVNPS